MYKFVIPDTKTKQNIFLDFLKYWSSSRDFNKLVIKAKMHAKIFFGFFFVVWKYDVITQFLTPSILLKKNMWNDKNEE